MDDDLLKLMEMEFLNSDYEVMHEVEESMDFETELDPEQIELIRYEG